MKLRRYQRDNIAAILLAFETHRRVVYVLPMGGGKTIVASRVIRDAVKRGESVVFFAHRDVLIDQAVERLIADGFRASDIGVVMADDKRLRPEAPIQVVSVQTFVRRKTAPPADLVVIDEAHRALADSYEAIFATYPTARVLGLTATPQRLDRRPMREAFDEMVIGATPLELIASGDLVNPRVLSVPEELLPDLRGVKVRGGDYASEELAAAVGKSVLVGSVVDHYKRYAAGRPTVLFAVNLALGRRYREAFASEGIVAECIDASTSLADRKAAVARTVRGETGVVINCEVLTEGWDEERMQVLICARPTKSLTLWLQMAGRIMRPCGDAPKLILDHAGNALWAGTPDMAREWSLDAPPKRSGTPRPFCKRCPACGFTMPIAALCCTECAHVFSLGPAEVAGELAEVKGPLPARVCNGLDGFCENNYPILSKNSSSGLCRLCAARSRRNHVNTCAGFNGNRCDRTISKDAVRCKNCAQLSRRKQPAITVCVNCGGSLGGIHRGILRVRSPTGLCKSCAGRKNILCMPEESKRKGRVIVGRKISNYLKSLTFDQHSQRALRAWATRRANRATP